MFDVEYFFDGYKFNLDYVIEVVKVVYEVGVCWVVLCDINGGVMFVEVYVVIKVVIDVGISGSYVGIYMYNDCE